MVDTAEQGAVLVEENLEMTTRDGVMLQADVYRPDGPGPFPVMLMRTPYGRRHRGELVPNREIQRYVARGYLVVHQDTRGRGGSAGTYRPFFDEKLDGYDTIEWAAALPWSNGKVGMVGQSYGASVQYFAAPTAPPHLVALSPSLGATNHFTNSIYQRGVLELRYRLAYFLAMERANYARVGTYRDERDRLDSYVLEPRAALSMMTDEAYRHLPLKDWGERVNAGAGWLADILDHSTYDSFWQDNEPRRGAADVTVPILHIGAWYDFFLDDALSMFTSIREQATSEVARNGQRLIIGPWAHMGFGTPDTGGAGDIDFGPDARLEVITELRDRWFEHHLKGEENGVMDEAPVRIFVMGINQWRDEQEWPLARTQYTELYLDSSGGANTINGDGALSFEMPPTERVDHFVYDPNDPVPTHGGPNIGAGVHVGVRDQREVEQRSDVLVYTGEVLAHDLEVTGPVKVVVHAASSAVDTDFTAKVVDVHPDGFAQNVVEGIVRARYRDSLEAPTLMTPETPYRFDIDCVATSHVFLAGHRIRLEVSSSNFPRYDRNANSGLKLGDDVELHPARQTVFHGGAKASHILLPVIPS